MPPPAVHLSFNFAQPRMHGGKNQPVQNAANDCLLTNARTGQAIQGDVGMPQELGDLFGRSLSRKRALCTGL